MQDFLILGIGVSEHKTDGVLRFEHYCKKLGLPYKILGEGRKWHGGDMSAGMGGGQKINEVVAAIEGMENKLLIICDTFDLIPVAGAEEILSKFNNLCGCEKILFSSEVYCWPDQNLEAVYPKTDTKYRFLNSGCIMGYRDQIYNLIKNGNNSVKDNDDDQLFFTRKYLAGENIVLDNQCHLFQAINGARQDIVLYKNRVYNKYTNSYPVFLHGNGPSKLFLNHIENYVEPQFQVNFPSSPSKSNNTSKVFMALYVDSGEKGKRTDFMNSVADINYDNKTVFVYDKSFDDEFGRLVNVAGYRYLANCGSYRYEDFINSDCDYYFLLEQKCIITNKKIIEELLTYTDGNHRIISPLLHKSDNKFFTNYWGALDNSGYYKRSDDYMDLVQYSFRGLWNAPYVSGAILFHGDIIRNWDLTEKNKHSNDTDMHLCFCLRKNTLFMYMVNFNTYGYLI